MQSIQRRIQLLLEFLLLLVTLRPSKTQGARLKVFGHPHFQGGPATKMTHLAPLLSGRFGGYSHILCLSAVRVPIVMLKLLRFLGAKIFVNQNGVYYPSWMPTGFEKRNQYLKQLNDLSHHSFFQSRFALVTFEKWVGEPPKSRSILHNPVDLAKFQPHPNGNREKIKVLFFSDIGPTSKNMWRFFLDLLREYPKEMEAYQWVLLGRVQDEGLFRDLGISELVQARKNIETHWNPQSDSLPALIADCNLLLYLRYNDVCPNKVLECLAAGLPVVGISAGGTKELVEDAGEILPVQEGFESPHYPSAKEIWNSLEKIGRDQRKFSERALARAKLFSLENWTSTIQQFMEKGSRE